VEQPDQEDGSQDEPQAQEGEGAHGHKAGLGKQEGRAAGDDDDGEQQAVMGKIFHGIPPGLVDISIAL